jgi:rare lipoprotein A
MNLDKPPFGVLPNYSIVLFLMALSACAGGSSPSTNGVGHYKVGQPYEIKGVTYTPQEDYSYDETGIASWYGQAFHEGTTANGEIFNKNELTAAHKTLPLPTLARVTNLENGRSIVVRINDRGPFSGARIIDVSQRAAQLLGFEQQGTAKVRVQVLADESKAIADAMRHYGSSPVIVASADQSQQQPTETAAPISTQAGAVETKELEPIRTTPAIHQQLIQTTPKQEVFIVPITEHNQLYIQAGAFTVVENATKLQQTLSKLGSAKISDIVINGKTFHRVRLGPIKDVTQADALLLKVRQAGVTNARTIVD